MYTCATGSTQITCDMKLRDTRVPPVVHDKLNVLKENVKTDLLQFFFSRI